MISIRKNPNFSKFFQVFSYGKFVDELYTQAEALEVAKLEAKNTKAKQINFLGKILDIQKKK
tara:strand:- start:311 stop:496 length:186 start_codon:yes stop_codon:yes gene_type:complete